MRRDSYHILRIGLAITFLWIGVLILKNPDAWTGYMAPWAANLMPVPVREAMIGTAFLDMALGVLLLCNKFVWVVALVASLHLLVVLIVSGITDITVRDIGLLAGATALFVDTLPANLLARMPWRKNEISQIQ